MVWDFRSFNLANVTGGIVVEILEVGFLCIPVYVTGKYASVAYRFQSDSKTSNATEEINEVQ